MIMQKQDYTNYWHQFTPCNANEQKYQQQANIKKNACLQLFKKNLDCDLSIIENTQILHSQKTHFRDRIEFNLKTLDGQLHYIMFAPITKEPIKITQCNHAAKAINDAMPILMAQLNTHPTLGQHCHQINFRTNPQEQLLITLIYRKSIEEKPPLWKKQLEQLHQKYGWNLIGRSHKKQWHCGQNHLDYTLHINQKKLIYRQDDNTFTQPNFKINEKMISWIQSHLPTDSTTDLLELYCGNGNFSIALCNQFRSVLATEIVRESLKLAHYAKEKNAIQNINFIRLSAEETAQALSNDRTFNRLKEIDIESYQISTVLVDPPRAGIDKKTLNFLQQFKRIIYVSCNPETLCNNLQTLNTTHTLKHLALFDQFPYTAHIESIAILVNG